MVTGVLTDFKSFLCPVRTSLLLVDNSSTSRFAEAIAREGREIDRDPFGSGSPSTGLKKRNRAIAQTNSVMSSVVLVDNLHV